MAITKEILDSHPVATLKREIGKTNIRGYSKLGKADLITLMMKNKERFGHIQMAEKKARAPRTKKEEKPKKEAKQAPVQGPRNLKKGFGIRRLPKESTPKPKSKLEETIAEYQAVLTAEKKRRGIKDKSKKDKSKKTQKFEDQSEEDKKKIADAFREATRGVKKIKKKKEVNNAPAADVVKGQKSPGKGKSPPKPAAAGPGKDEKDAMFEKITGDSVANLPKYKPNKWKTKFWNAVTENIREGNWNEDKMKGYIFGFFDNLPEKYRDYFVTGNGKEVNVKLDMGEFKTARWLFYNRFLHRDKPGDPYPVSGYLLMSVFKDANKTAVNDKYPGTALTAKYYSDTDANGDNERLTGPLYYISLVKDREWF